MNITAQSFIHFYQNFFSINPSILKSKKNMCALILAPHPDDECLMATFALRLKLENNAQVIACAVTLGSLPERQKEREQEFKNSCAVLGLKPHILNSNDELSHLVELEKVNLIIAPHLGDHHPTHIKTAKMARELIEKVSFTGIFLETEFWGELTDPNLLVEVTKEAFELEFNALTKHVGEISRNPYHLRLAANLVNNVRRGAERVSSLGSASPNFAFGSLYRGYQVKDAVMTPLTPQILDYSKDLSSIF